jgi:hypothetical protein
MTHLPKKFLLDRILSLSLIVGSKKIGKRVLEWEYDNDHTCILYEVVWESDKEEIQSDLKDIIVSSHDLHLCEKYVYRVSIGRIPPPSVDTSNSRLFLFYN